MLVVSTEWSGRAFHWWQADCIWPQSFSRSIAQPNSLGFSGTDGGREGSWHTPQQGARRALTVPVCLRTHACVQDGIAVFGFLSEIDGVEQLLFYLIYL